MPGAGTITIRESWQARLFNALVVAFFMLVMIPRTHGGLTVALIALWALLLLADVVRLIRPAAILTPTEIRVNNMRPCQIPWGRIREVTATKRMGTMQIELVLDDASRVLLEAPTADLLTPRGRFNASVEAIRSHWVAHRGPTRPTTAPGD